jgi:hypothetical protein
MVTVAPAAKLWPLIVNPVPPAVGPTAGVTALRVKAGTGFTRSAPTAMSAAELPESDGQPLASASNNSGPPKAR